MPGISFYAQIELQLTIPKAPFTFLFNEHFYTSNRSHFPSSLQSWSPLPDTPAKAADLPYTCPSHLIDHHSVSTLPLSPGFIPVSSWSRRYSHGLILCAPRLAYFLSFVGWPCAFDSPLDLTWIALAYFLVRNKSYVVLSYCYSSSKLNSRIQSDRLSAFPL